MLVHDSGLPEVPFELLQALNPSICNLATFLGVEHRPLSAVELAMEVQDEVVVHEIDKGVTDICLVFVVDRDIEEVVLALVVLVDFLQQKSLIVFVGDVLYHDCRAGVLPTL